MDDEKEESAMTCIAIEEKKTIIGLEEG